MNPKLRLLHLLAAFPLGLIIAIISFSGAMLALEDSLTPLLQPKQTKVEQVLTAQKPAADIVASVQRAIPDSFSVTSITYANDPQATVRVGYSESRRSAMVADPYTAQVVGKQERHPFFMTMFRLHRWLLDKPGGLGNQIVGASVVLFIIALLSGLVIWWPKTWSTFRKKARIVTGRGRHPFFYSLHGAGGFFASIFLLLLALTGLTWTYAPYKKAFYGVFGLEAPQRGGAPAGKDKAKGGRPDGKPEGKPAEARGQRPEGGENRGQGRGEQDARTLNTAQWQAVLAQLQQKHPNWNEITLEDG
ncbi:MAG: PepSY domain-containing protein, partial [Bacteroidaceae bacterium]|nr:PepSY domain-containing protein [Bacteroidaceae bacterium]